MSCFVWLRRVGTDVRTELRITCVNIVITTSMAHEIKIRIHCKRIFLFQFCLIMHARRYIKLENSIEILSTLRNLIIMFFSQNYWFEFKWKSMRKSSSPVILVTLVLIHSANPKSRPIVIIVFAHVVRPSVRTSVPTFQI